MAFMWNEDRSYNYKHMFPLAAATSSNWGSNVFQFMLLKTSKDSLQFAVGGNEFGDPDPFYIKLTPRSQTSHISDSTKTETITGNKAIKVTVDTKKKGEYVLKLTTDEIDTTTAEDQAETAALLLSQAALLRQLGEKLLLQPDFFKSLDN